MNKLWDVLVIVMVMMSPITQAVADRHNNALNYYRTNSTSSTGITEQRAITIAQQRFKGRVLAINHSENIYRIKVLDNQGTIHIIQINAADGAIISTH